MTILSENENAVLSSTSVLTSENILESAGAAFKFTVDTTETGVTASDTFRLPMDSPSVNVDILVSSPDLIGSPVNITDISIVNDLQFNTGGVHEITCVNNGTNILQWRFRGGANNGGDKNKFISIEEWGIFQLTYGSAFQGCVNLTTIPTSGTPIMPTISSAGGGSMFNGCSSLIVNTDTDVSGWDVSFINNFDQFAHDVGSWNPSGMDSWVPSICTNFSEMFEDSGFVGALPSWNTSSGATFKSMFKNCGIDFDMSGWDFTNLVGVNGGQNFMYGVTTFSTENYDKLLVSLGSQNVNTGVTIHFGSSAYTSPSPASEGRTALLSKGWIITDTSDYPADYVARYEFPSSDITTALVGSGLTNSGASYDDDAQRGDSTDYNGTSSYMTLPALGIGTGEQGISMWFNANTFASELVLLDNSGQPVKISSSTVISIRGTTFTVPTMNTSVWYHLCFTRDGSNNVRLYLNGVESSSGVLTNIYDLSWDTISRAVNKWFDGKIAFASFYDYQLTADNVTALYNDETWVPRDAVTEYNFADGAFLDDSIASLDLSNFGATQVNDSEVGYCAELDGASYLSLPSVPSGTSTGQASWCLLFKNDGSTLKPYLGNAGATDYMITSSYGSDNVRIRNGASWNTFNTANQDQSEWYYLCFTRDSLNNVNASLDGVQSASNPISVTGNLDFDEIGRDLTNFLTGRVAKIQYFNRDLSPNEQLANNNAYGVA